MAKYSSKVSKPKESKLTNIESNNLEYLKQLEDENLWYNISI
ncbi:hypothetical protein [Sedimentibacter sp. MB31-C6]|nr:hypothetical protein [Sedimentibacter sp. MB36-C1]WSI03226.1 hypothetical protein U8307_09235 [Sedimentibacter sp. MB36-C1]